MSTGNYANKLSRVAAEPETDSPEMGDHFAAVYEATAHRITGPVSNTALSLVGVGPGTRILDIAAGAGALSGPAAERGARVLATDVAPGMVRRLAERLRPFRQCEARQMNGEVLTVPDASFDAAFSIFGVMLFSDWRRGLREQARVLRSGGKACVATLGEPPGGGPFIAMGAALRSVFPDLSPPLPPSGMLALSDPDRLSAEMSAAGLASIEVQRPKAKFLARTRTGRHRQNGSTKRWLLSSQGIAAWLNED
jgi:SAM-dependent methyltransferase